MIYLCTNIQQERTQHTFYDCVEKTFYGLDCSSFESTKPIYLKYTTISDCFDDCEIFDYVLPEKLNIVIYKTFNNRKAIIENILLKLIFDSL